MILAISKGRVFDIFKKKISNFFFELSRKIIFNTIFKFLKIVCIKPLDIYFYLKKSNFIGIIGKDIYFEFFKNKKKFLYIDLNFFNCRISLIENNKNKNNKLIFTKYKNITKNIFKKYKVKYLNGTFEVPVLLGYSRYIVDIIESGQTIKKNKLLEKKTLINNINPILIFKIKNKNYKKIIFFIKCIL
ncbi:hypothetical protein ACT2CR_00305 [Candidatus Vidania fulgoroideorum]